MPKQTINMMNTIFNTIFNMDTLSIGIMLVPSALFLGYSYFSSDIPAPKYNEIFIDKEVEVRSSTSDASSQVTITLEGV